MADHDNGYKLLFSHAETVADFLRGFVKEDWVRELDFSTLKRVDGTYVSDDLRSRESDVVWRPRLRYMLFDELRLPEVPREERENLAAALFRLEQARAPVDFGQRIDELVELLRTNPDLRRSFTTWLTRVLLPSRFPGVRFPEIQDLQEIQTMGLAERVMEWTREWKEEGRIEGLQEVILSLLDQRFGTAVSAETRTRVLAIRDVYELNRIAKGVLRASSLRDLGLG